MRRLKKRTPDEGIDISPLIDVVFILLIFFMVSTTCLIGFDLPIIFL